LPKQPGTKPKRRRQAAGVRGKVENRYKKQETTKKALLTAYFWLFWEFRAGVFGGGEAGGAIWRNCSAGNGLKNGSFWLFEGKFFCFFGGCAGRSRAGGHKRGWLLLR